MKQFVREQTQLRRELEGTPFHLGGSVFDNFIDGLKPDVQTFVLNNPPTGWWTGIQEIYQKAWDFGMNGLASAKAKGHIADSRSAEAFKTRVFARSIEKGTGLAGKKRARGSENDTRYAKRKHL